MYAARRREDRTLRNAGARCAELFKKHLGEGEPHTGVGFREPQEIQYEEDCRSNLLNGNDIRFFWFWGGVGYRAKEITRQVLMQ